jgi:hypothetical protein
MIALTLQIPVLPELFLVVTLFRGGSGLSAGSKTAYLTHIRHSAATGAST